MFCGYCGENLPEGAEFCGKCGKKVVRMEAPARLKAPDKKTAPPKMKEPVRKESNKKPSGTQESSGPQKGSGAQDGPKKGKRKLKAVALVAFVVVVFIAGRSLIRNISGRSSGSGFSSPVVKDMADLQEWEVEIENDVQASYYHDFVNLIPFYEDVPYVSVDGHGLYPTITYNWLSMVQNRWGESLPYERLRTAYSYVLSDIYVLNGRPEKELEMAQYFYCHNSVTTFDAENMGVDEWNAYDGLLWYMTFLNYRCNIETEENENGTLVHVKISNTDMVKLLYEELENTYNMVREDNQQAASERLNGVFGQVKTYFNNEAENYSHVDHWTINDRPGIGNFSIDPVYGNSFISKLNLVELAGGLIFEQAKYQKNRQFWGELSDDGTLYNYTLSQMLVRMLEGDCDTVNTELTFYADVDSKGNGFIPFDRRTNFSSFVKADQDWDTLVDVLKSKNLAASNCSMSNIQSGDPIYTWGLASTHDYENMLLWVIMGWRGSIVKGQPVTEYADTLGYAGKVEAVTSGASGSSAPREVVEGKSVFADPDPATGLYEVDGVLYEISNGEAKAVGTTEGFDQTDLTLPKEINDCPLTALGECAFFGCESLISLAIPEGVRILEKNAVASNDNLVSISLPGTLTEIGIGAFVLDTALTQIEIPYGVTIIKQGAFLSCISLEELTVPESVEEIEYGAFDNCTSLQIVVPKTTRSGQYAFRQVAGISYY